MSESDQMPKIDQANKQSTKLKQTEIDFMRIIERQNLERVQKLKRVRRNNIVTGWCIGAGVLGIYLYSMFAIKQERFLDDFNEPEKTVE